MARRRLVAWPKTLGLLAVAGVAVAVILHAFFGLRVTWTGGLQPRVAFAPSADELATEVEQHRAAQRTAAPEAPSGPSSGPEAPSAPEAPEAPEAPPPAYWTDFRGPARDGRYTEQPVLEVWPDDGLEPIWQQPVGGGYASFVVARGRAFTIEQRRDEEVVAAYDVETGLELWTDRWTAAFREAMGGDGPRATPTWADGTVYALGATGELRALDEATGAIGWRTNILEDAGARNLEWGMAASPLVIGDTLIVLPGGSGGQSVVAYDRESGDRVWSAQDDQAGYSAPMLVGLAGREQLLVLSAERLMGLTPDAGDLLWSYPWVTNSGINVSQPIVVGDDRVFVSSGYGVGAAVVAVTPDGDGFAVSEVWRNNRMKNKFTSSVLHDGYVYGLDEAILACVDVETGELMWKGGRYGYGQVLLVDDRLIVLTEDGDLVQVAASPDGHQELAHFAVLEGRTWNHLALDDGRLLVRNVREMAAFDLRLP